MAWCHMGTDKELKVKWDATPCRVQPGGSGVRAGGCLPACTWGKQPGGPMVLPSAAGVWCLALLVQLVGHVAPRPLTLASPGPEYG